MGNDHLKADSLLVGLLSLFSVMYCAAEIAKMASPAPRSAAVPGHSIRPTYVCIGGHYRLDPIQRVWLGRQAGCSIAPYRARMVAHWLARICEQVILDQPLELAAGFYPQGSHSRPAAP